MRAFVIIVALLLLALIFGHGKGAYQQPNKPAAECLAHAKTCDLRNY